MRYLLFFTCMTCFAQTELMTAVHYNYDRVKWIIDSVRNTSTRGKFTRYINKVDHVNNQTALHFAAGRNPDPRVVELLLKCGAKLNAKTKSGITPLMEAMHYNCLLYTSPSPRDRQKSRMPSSA